MIEPKADRDDIGTQLRAIGVVGWSRLVAADDLLIVDLRCPTCVDGWRNYDDGTYGGMPHRCHPCHGTGRRTVKVVDADHYARFCAVVRAGAAWNADSTDPALALALCAWLDALTPDDIKAVSK